LDCQALSTRREILGCRRTTRQPRLDDRDLKTERQVALFDRRLFERRAVHTNLETLLASHRQSAPESLVARCKASATQTPYCLHLAQLVFRVALPAAAG